MFHFISLILLNFAIRFSIIRLSFHPENSYEQNETLLEPSRRVGFAAVVERIYEMLLRANAYVFVRVGLRDYRCNNRNDTVKPL